MTEQARVAPNPYSPFADADPNYRHSFANFILAPHPKPGTLVLTNCGRLTVVPDEPLRVMHVSVLLPDGLCPACVSAAQCRAAAVADDRSTRECAECGSITRHDGLCALCRQERHDAWWATRGVAGSGVRA